MDYSILRNEILPTALQNQPRWVTCLACTVGLLIITLSAVSVGAFIGYTYCYVEHRRGFRKDDTIHATKLKTDFHLKHQENDKKTINSILFSSVLVSRLVQIGQNIKDDITHMPLANLKDSSYRLRSQPDKPQFH